MRIRPTILFVIAALSMAIGARAETDKELSAIYLAGDFARMQSIALRGDVNAEPWMALMLQHQGRRSEAKTWWGRAAERGNLGAIGSLAAMHLHDREDAEAAKWLKRGAEAGSASLQTRYADFLASERGGNDPAEAARWYGAAVRQQYSHAYLPLAQILSAGREVPADLVEAYALAAVGLDEQNASDVGSAAELKESIAVNLSPRQLQEAERRAREYLPDFAARDRTRIWRNFVVNALLLGVAAFFLAIVGSIMVVSWHLLGTMARFVRRR